MFVENITSHLSIYSKLRVHSAKHVMLFYASIFLLFLFLLNIFTIFYFTEFCAVIIDLSSLSQTLPFALKESRPSANTERGTAELISRLVKYIRVARLPAPGTLNFLKYCCTYWIVFFVAYHLVHVIAYCMVFLVVYRLVRVIV